MTEPNPYAPPTEQGPESPRKKKAARRKPAKERTYWREGDCVVMEKEGTRLPKRCVACNAPMDGDRVMRQFTWHPPWVYALVFCGWLPYMVAAASTRKGARVELGLCYAHQTQRRQGLTIAWAGGGAALVLLVIAAKGGVQPLVLLSLLMLVALPIIGGRMARVCHPKKIDDRHLWLKVGAPFLASIPPRDD